MAGKNDPITCLSVSANGATDWAFADGAGYAGDAENFCLRAVAIGSGAVGATVTAYRGSRIDGTIYYDDVPAATFTLSGNHLSVASQAFVQTGDVHWRFVVASITAATTVKVACGWWSE